MVIARYVLDGVGVLCLLIWAVQVVAAVRAHHGLHWWKIDRTISVSLKGTNLISLIMAVILLSAIFLGQLFPESILPVPVFFGLGISLLALNRVCLPPAILLLGASRPNGYGLATDLETIVPPLKMVHLLDVMEAGFAVGEALRNSSVRVSHGWVRAVRTLSAIAPVVIVDLRDMTPNILREVVHLIEDGQHRRVFLIADNACAPAEISRLCEQSGVQICVVTHELLKMALRDVGWSVLLNRTVDLYSYIEVGMDRIVADYLGRS